MKRIVWIGIAGVAAVAAGLVGRAAWHAHKNIVSLHVRNATVAEVVRKLERQTWETIIADTNLNSLITLDLKNVPLSEALDRVAEQAGGLSGVYHAVYNSAYSLRQLKTALGRGAGDCDGWTNLAPEMNASLDNRSSSAGISGSDANAGVNKAIEEALKGVSGKPRVVIRGQPIVTTKIASSDAGTNFNLSGIDSSAIAKSIQEALRQAVGGQGTGAISGPDVAGQPRVATRVIRLDAGTNTVAGSMDSSELSQAVQQALQQALSGNSLAATNRSGTIRARPSVTVRLPKRSGDGEAGEMEEWTPERLTMQTSLVPRLGDGFSCEATRASAEAVARKVRAQARTLYALKKSPVGMPALSVFPRSGKFLSRSTGVGTATNLDGLAASLESQIRRDKVEQYLNLTPEQRAQRARGLR